MWCFRLSFLMALFLCILKKLPVIAISFSFFFEKFTHTRKQETNYNRFVDEEVEKNLNDRKSCGEVANIKPKEVFSLELKQSKKLTASCTKAANKKVCLYLDFKNQMNGFVLAPRGPCHVRVTSKKE